MITTGEGGALTTKTEESHLLAKVLRSHGIPEERSELKKKGMPEWYYEQVSLGHNYRLSEIQAALGFSQIQRLNSFIQIRNELALEYRRLLNCLPLKLQRITEVAFLATNFLLFR